MPNSVEDHLGFRKITDKLSQIARKKGSFWGPWRVSAFSAEDWRSLPRGCWIVFGKLLKINTWCLNLWLFGLGDQAVCLSSPSTLPKSLASSLDLGKALLWSYPPQTTKEGCTHSSHYSPSRLTPAEFTAFPDKNARNFHHFLQGMTK